MLKAENIGWMNIILTETSLRSLVSVQKFVQPAICLPSWKRERILLTIKYFVVWKLLATWIKCNANILYFGYPQIHKMQNVYVSLISM